jgi:hypothetical protein
MAAIWCAAFITGACAAPLKAPAEPREASFHDREYRIWLGAFELRGTVRNGEGEVDWCFVDAGCRRRRLRVGRIEREQDLAVVELHVGRTWRFAAVFRGDELIGSVSLMNAVSPWEVREGALRVTVVENGVDCVRSYEIGPRLGKPEASCDTPTATTCHHYCPKPEDVDAVVLCGGGELYVAGQRVHERASFQQAVAALAVRTGGVVRVNADYVGQLHAPELCRALPAWLQAVGVAEVRLRTVLGESCVCTPGPCPSPV